MNADFPVFLVQPLGAGPDGNGTTAVCLLREVHHLFNNTNFYGVSETLRRSRGIGRRVHRRCGNGLHPTRWRLEEW